MRTAMTTISRLSIIAVLGLSTSAWAGAGDLLQGVAKIIEATSPMVVAGIQAKADVDIAKINSDSQIKMTEITADTSKYLSDAQKDVALFKAETAKEINKINNDGQTERLGMQLNELHDARKDALEADREKRQLEHQYNMQRIELAKKQADMNYKLAKATLAAQLTQAGLISGMKYQNSAASLSVSSVLGKQSASRGAMKAVSLANNRASMKITRSASGLTVTGSMAPKAQTTLRLLAALNASHARSPRMRTSGSSVDGSPSRTSMAAKQPTLPSNQPLSNNFADYVPHRNTHRESPLTPAGGHSGGGGYEQLAARGFRAVSPYVGNE